MNPFFPLWIASFVVASAWTMLAMTNSHRDRRVMGVVGAWAATAVLTALWQAEAVPWLWVFLQGVLLVWLGAMALLITGVVSIWRVNEQGRRSLLCCAILSITVHIAAGFLFLWLAIVSPGGV